MLSRFFVDKPVFAWVIAVLLILAGAVSITRLPISRYPDIAPPAISISATYSGASAEAAQESVTQILEQNMSGLDGLLYMSSTSDSTGAVTVTLTFASGTDPDIAQVQVQNKVQQATPLLPQIVQQQGISVNKVSTSFLLAIGVYSEDGSMNRNDIADYLSSNVVDPLSRVTGVGNVLLFGAPYAMRIWLDPQKLQTYSLTPADITTAVNAQNAQVTLGQVGGTPAVPGQQINATITSQSRLRTPQQFRDIVLRANTDGSLLRLSDVARVELGAQDYNIVSTYNGKPASGIGVYLATGANALSTAANIQALMAQLRPTLPHGLRIVVPYDTTPYVRVSIHEVIKTLIEAIFLVFLVMYLFLQNLRATIIPTIAVPVVLMGTFTVLLFMGYSINMLTMFAMVLAIGLLVDDAIVVVENVERVMSEEGLSPIEATRKSMDQISGALIGIATVLSAVFVPMAFLSGSTGVIYRQFSVTIVSAMALSVLVALIITPALSATILKPMKKGAHGSERGFFRWFNRWFDSANLRYQGAVTRILGRTGRFMLIYLAISALMGLLFIRLPTSFLPDEDQGFLFTMVQAPVGATQQRTLRALAQVEHYFLVDEKASVKSLFAIQGFSFSGYAQNTGLGFVLLKDWDQRTSPSQSVGALVGRAYMALGKIKDAMAYAYAPPPVTELGTSAGFDFFLKDIGDNGHEALVQARNMLLGMALKDKLLTNVRPNGQEDAPQFHVDIDAQKVGALGLSMADVNDTLSVAWGSRYIDDFIDRGRVKRVYLQADAPFRMVPADFNRWYVRNAGGEMVPVSAFASMHWAFGPPQLARYNGEPAMEINGQAAPGVSSGQAMQEIQKLAARLPPGYAVDWTGQSYQERAAGAQTPALYTLSLIVIFLCLAALYESWSIPTSILLAVPLGVVGAVLATALRGLERDIYFQVAMLTTIGLAAKNAILIVEFAKAYVDRGTGLVQATVHAARDRLRPILMTSLAFGLGVLPMAVATGAGAGAQRAIGTGVFGGMIAGTFMGIFFVPVFYVVVQRLRVRLTGHGPSEHDAAGIQAGGEQS